ncbi:plasma membrane calcium, partial [Gryganskiella cystojenkinii]
MDNKLDLDSSRTHIEPADPPSKDSNTNNNNNFGSGSIDIAALHDQDHSDTNVTIADPRPVNNGPFTFTSDELMDLIDPKSTATLATYGGVQGVLAGLHANPTKGLSTSDRQPLSAVVTSGDDEKAFVDTPPVDKVSIADREQFFGRNEIPKRKPKSIFQLMWMALQEKIL